MEVTIYSTPSCVYCNNAKAFFNEHNIPFEAIDITSDLSLRQEMIDLTGQMSVPVIKVDDQVFIGFTENQSQLRLALGIDSQE